MTKEQAAPSRNARNMSAKSMSEINHLKEQARKDRLKKAIAQADINRKTIKECSEEIIFTLEPRKDDTFLSSTIKAVLPDFRKFVQALSSKQSNLLLGLDDSDPASLEKAISSGGIKLLPNEVKNGPKKGPRNPIKSQSKDKPVKNESTTATSMHSKKPQQDQAPPQQKAKNTKISKPKPPHIQTGEKNNKRAAKEDAETSEVNIENILKEMIIRMDPPLTDIETPKVRVKEFEFPVPDTKQSKEANTKGGKSEKTEKFKKEEAKKYSVNKRAQSKTQQTSKSPVKVQLRKLSDDEAQPAAEKTNNNNNINNMGSKKSVSTIMEIINPNPKNRNLSTSSSSSSGGSSSGSSGSDSSDSEDEEEERKPKVSKASDAKVSISSKTSFANTITSATSTSELKKKLSTITVSTNSIDKSTPTATVFDSNRNVVTEMEDGLPMEIIFDIDIEKPLSPLPLEDLIDGHNNDSKDSNFTVDDLLSSTNLEKKIQLAEDMETDTVDSSAVNNPVNSNAKDSTDSDTVKKDSDNSSKSAILHHGKPNGALYPKDSTSKKEQRMQSLTSKNNKASNKKGDEHNKQNSKSNETKDKDKSKTTRIEPSITASDRENAEPFVHIENTKSEQKEDSDKKSNRKNSRTAPAQAKDQQIAKNKKENNLSAKNEKLDSDDVFMDISMPCEVTVAQTSSLATKPNTATTTTLTVTSSLTKTLDLSNIVKTELSTHSQSLKDNKRDEQLTSPLKLEFRPVPESSSSLTLNENVKPSFKPIPDITLQFPSISAEPATTTSTDAIGSLGNQLPLSNAHQIRETQLPFPNQQQQSPQNIVKNELPNFDELILSKPSKNILQDLEELVRQRPMNDPPATQNPETGDDLTKLVNEPVVESHPEIIKHDVFNSNPPSSLNTLLNTDIKTSSERILEFEVPCFNKQQNKTSLINTNTTTKNSQQQCIRKQEKNLPLNHKPPPEIPPDEKPPDILLTIRNQDCSLNIKTTSSSPKPDIKITDELPQSIAVLIKSTNSGPSCVFPSSASTLPLSNLTTSVQTLTNSFSQQQPIPNSQVPMNLSSFGPFNSSLDNLGSVNIANNNLSNKGDLNPTNIFQHSSQKPTETSSSLVGLSVMNNPRMNSSLGFPPSNFMNNMNPLYPFNVNNINNNSNIQQQHLSHHRQIPPLQQTNPTQPTNQIEQQLLEPFLNNTLDNKPVTTEMPFISPKLECMEEVTPVNPQTLISPPTKFQDMKVGPCSSFKVETSFAETKEINKEEIDHTLLLNRQPQQAKYPLHPTPSNLITDGLKRKEINDEHLINHEPAAKQPKLDNLVDVPSPGNCFDIINNFDENSVDKDSVEKRPLLVRIPLNFIKLKDNLSSDTNRTNLKRKLPFKVGLEDQSEVIDVLEPDSPLKTCNRSLSEVQEIIAKKVSGGSSDIVYENGNSHTGSKKFALKVRINLSKLNRTPRKQSNEPQQRLLRSESIDQKVSYGQLNEDLINRETEADKKKKRVGKREKKDDGNFCKQCGVLRVDASKDYKRLAGYKLTYQYYTNEGTRKKHQADSHTDPVKKSHTYIDAVLNYVQYLVGHEQAKMNTMEGVGEYMRITTECISLVEYVVTTYARKNQSLSTCDKGFLFLCLRLQSILYLKLAKVKKDSTIKSRKVLASYYKQFKPANLIGRSPFGKTSNPRGSTGTPSPSSPSSGPSPGSVASIGSAGSSGSAGCNEKSGPGMMTIPNEMHEWSYHYFQNTKNLLQGHRLWDEADSLIHFIPNFVQNLSKSAGMLTMQSSLLQVVDYVSSGLQTLKDLLPKT